jgi:hypothetical protein
MQTKTRKATARTSNKEAVSPNYALLKKMWEAGESYKAIAEATDAGYDTNKADPTKLTRWRIWRARHIGVRINGKLVKFGEPQR